MTATLFLDANTVSAFASCVSAVTALIGVPIVILQLRNFRRTQQSQALTTVYQQYVELDRYFLDDLELHAAIYGSKPVDTLSLDLRARAEVAAEFVTDILYQAYEQKTGMGLKMLLPEANYIRAILSAPIMREFLSKRASWYSKEFLSDVLRGT